MEPPCRWSPEDTQALLGVWSEEKTQRQLKSFITDKTYREVSDRMAAMGMSYSAKQCRARINYLKRVYRRIKALGERSRVLRKPWWYDAMAAIMGPAVTDSTDQSGSPTITDIPGRCPTPNHALPFTAPSSALCPTESPQEPTFHSIQLADCDDPPTGTTATQTVKSLVVTKPYKPQRRWSDREVQALVTLWAHPTVQQELLVKVKSNEVYTCLSGKLASLGFNKAPEECRRKIQSLKQAYKRMKNCHHMGRDSSVWFAAMDEVLSSQAAGRKRSAEPSSAEPSPPTQSVVLDVDTDDEAQWLPDEVKVLLTLWVQLTIKKQLLTTAADKQVFTHLSNELALMGFNKTPHQCSLKVDKLTEEYKKMKQVEPNGGVRRDWFAILDCVLGPNGETSKEVDSSAMLTEPELSDDEHVYTDTLQPVWTSDEVQWAEDSFQEQGFGKTTSQCRSKIRQVKQRFNRIEEQKDSKKQKSRWFAIMDEVLGRRKPEMETKQAAEVTDSEPISLQASQQDIPETVEGCPMSVSSLRLLVPTLRLMCAFAWQVVQCGNVAHYGKVEELVRVVTEFAPELLTPKEKVQLLLRLRARLVLELCLSESTANLLNIQPHLKVIQDLTTSSGCDQEELEELENSKSNFVQVVRALLEDTEERTRFFKKVFPVHFGQQYEVTLHTLIWKFISRLDNLLPIPDVKQTAEWLSTTPSLIEECGQLVLEADHLKALLHFHQQQSGNANKCFSQAQNSFLPVLPLGLKASSKQQEVSTSSADEVQFECSEDKESVEENQTGVKPTLDDCSKGNEDLKLNDEPK